MSITTIRDTIYHAHPFLFIDHILEREQSKYCIALKNISYNEWFFPGHFPEKPIMPGVIMLEAMAQTSGLVIGKGEELKIFAFASMDNVKFRKTVEPGDQLIIRADCIKQKTNFLIFETKADVRKPNGETGLAVSATMKFAHIKVAEAEQSQGAEHSAPQER